VLGFTPTLGQVRVATLIVFDIPLALSSGIKVKNLPILNEMQTQGAFISSHEKKVVKAFR
jgi:hypothetical protein